MPRTTLEIDANILRELKLRAAAEGKSVGDVASELLAITLRDPSPGSQPEIDWVRKDMGRPTVDLEGREAL